MLRLTVVLAALPTGVLATPLRVTDVFFNFNAGAFLAPGEQFSGVLEFLAFGYFQAPVTLVVDVNTERNGTGVVDSTTFTVQPSNFPWNAFAVMPYSFPGGLSDPGILDGTFSIGFRLTAGDLDLQLLYADVTTNTGQSISFSPDSVFIPEPIPEPASLPLVGLALVVGAFMRRTRPPKRRWEVVAR
jgi:hypothetical protein